MPTIVDKSLCTANDIDLLLHIISRYLSIPEDEIPELQENVMETKIYPANKRFNTGSVRISF